MMWIVGMHCFAYSFVPVSHDRNNSVTRSEVLSTYLR